MLDLANEFVRNDRISVVSDEEGLGGEMVRQSGSPEEPAS